MQRKKQKIVVSVNKHRRNLMASQNCLNQRPGMSTLKLVLYNIVMFSTQCSSETTDLYNQSFLNCGKKWKKNLLNICRKVIFVIFSLFEKNLRKNVLSKNTVYYIAHPFSLWVRFIIKRGSMKLWRQIRLRQITKPSQLTPSAVKLLWTK